MKTRTDRRLIVFLPHRVIFGNLHDLKHNREYDPSKITTASNYRLNCVLKQYCQLNQIILLSNGLHISFVEKIK